MNRLVMIADIIDSRNLTNRKQVQTELESLLGELNGQQDQLLSPYTITLGDEFQALYDGADRVFPDILAIMRQLHPVELRFALGVGSLSTDINPERAIGMDGPAFHRARDLLADMKHDSRTLAITGLPDDDGLQEAALGLFNLQLRKWHPNRLAILQQLLQDRGITDIAQDLGITERSVYKNIHEGGLAYAIQLIRALTRRMNGALSH
ncbi:SatD family protein [Halospina denitrificans]|uniref:SatD family protein n=1 Tax=Halospina denitrificans TaxID=332522 RepID=A0A4R7JKY0_9GAMM|nr:SatD family protein [Halospina denitrificans]TDT37747.1 SatD family protein [Halospina denitrificans]